MAEETKYKLQELALRLQPLLETPTEMNQDEVLEFLTESVASTHTAWKSKGFICIDKGIFQDTEELAAELNLLSIHALRTWDSSKAQFSTWIWWIVQNRMINLLKEQKHITGRIYAPDGLSPCDLYIPSESKPINLPCLQEMALNEMFEDAKYYLSIAKLDEEEKAYYIAQHYVALRIADIADKYDVTFKRVRHKIGTANAKLKIMRRQLKDDATYI